MWARCSTYPVQNSPNMRLVSAYLALLASLPLVFGHGQVHNFITSQRTYAAADAYASADPTSPLRKLNTYGPAADFTSPTITCGVCISSIFGCHPTYYAYPQNSGRWKYSSFRVSWSPSWWTCYLWLGWLVLCSRWVCALFSIAEIDALMTYIWYPLEVLYVFGFFDSFWGSRRFTTSC